VLYTLGVFMMISIGSACRLVTNQSRELGGRTFIPAMTLVVGLLIAAPAAWAADLGKISTFDIPAETLDKALLQFGVQARIQIMFAWDSGASRIRTKELRGALVERSALAELLKGTGLSFVLHGNTVEIVRGASPSVHADKDDPPPSPSVAPAAGSSPFSSAARDRQRAHDDRVSLQEIVVTGTHIAGVTAIASPTSTYSQDYIYSTGAGSIGEFIGQLPGNFSETSEMNQVTTPSGPGATTANAVGAVGFDIHGLGVQSTLVLVNGYRVSSGNDEGNFVDVSLLPLSAIERIDVVKDSASAIYGADAVGGVVNVLTDTHLNGSDTRVRYGQVTQGGRTETTVSQALGTSWEGGTAVLDYEYGDETPLAASSRSFSQQAPGPFSLLPEQTRHSFYGSLTQSLRDDLVLSGFVLYGHRTLQDSYFFSGTNSVLDSNTVDGLMSEAGLERDFASGDVARASVEYSTNDSHHTSVLGSGSTPRKYSPYGNYEGKSSLGAFDLEDSGSIAIPGDRALRYAVGGQAREEKLTYTNYLPLSIYQPDRTVLSEYAEVHLPVVRSLDLTAAYRHEHYSDFGSTNNPKLGFEWTPTGSISVSATYSEAFRAPALFDMNPVPTAGLYIALPDPLKGGLRGACGFLPPPQVGCTPVLILYGGNANLKPETAKSWTTSLAVHPGSIPGLKAALSLYDVKYYNRINLLSEAYGNPLNVLEDESEFGSNIVQRGLSNQQIQGLAQSAGPNLFNYTGVVPGEVTTLVDDRSLNLSRLSTRGIDFDLSYSHRLWLVTTSSELEGTRVLQYRSQFTSSSAPIDALNTAYNPLKLKMRLREAASLDHFTGTVFVNYTGSYTNTLVVPTAPVASWLTVDASIAYRLSLSAGDARSAYLTIGCLNLANRTPPFVSNPTYPVNFDGANASPLGRFAYAEARLML
jgi:iron complex outermembrane receptor protein